jgi:hypothetical protein
MVRRRLTVSGWMTKHDLFLPAPEKADPAWAQVLAEGDNPQLEVKFISRVDSCEEDDEWCKRDIHLRSTLVKAWKTARGETFITVSQFNAQGADPLEITSSQVTYGRLVEGSPWDAPSYKPHNRLIEADPVTIELYYTMQVGQNGYKAYRVSRIKITDKSRGLPSSVFDLQGEALKSALEIVATHHSLNDAFVIRLPHAEYRVGLGLKVTYQPQWKLPELSRDLQCTQVASCGRPL